jgi:hypothetical protein
MQLAHASSCTPPASVDISLYRPQLMERFNEILLFRSSFLFLLFHIILPVGEELFGFNRALGIWEETQKRKRTYATTLLVCAILLLLL